MPVGRTRQKAARKTDSPIPPPKPPREIAEQLQKARNDIDARLKENKHLKHDRQLRKLDQQNTTRRRMSLDSVLGGLQEDRRAECEQTAVLLEEFCGTLLTSSAGAGERRGEWHVIARLGAGLAAVAAAAGGSTLIAGFQGTWSKVVGVAVLAVGVLGAAFNALGGEQEYERNRAKRRAYDELWWEAWNYALYQLVDDDKGKRHAKLNEFKSRWQKIEPTTDGSVGNVSPSG